MALNNYAALQSSIAGFLNRRDLTDRIPDFITLTEAKLRRRYKDFADLSDSNSSNWILAGYPDVYLYGALTEAAPYLIDDERVGVWKSLYTEAINTLKGVYNGANLDSYDGLVISISDWLARADLDAHIPQLIALAEIQIARDVRHYQMENRARATASSQFVERPDDWIETITAKLITPGTSNLKFATRSQMDDMRQTREDTSGQPRFYTHSENSFELYPTPDGEYTMEVLYYQSIPALGPSNQTNWLLGRYGDLYLYASLIHAEPYLKNDERVGVWASMYAGIVKNINRESKKATVSGRNLRMKIRGAG